MVAPATVGTNPLIGPDSDALEEAVSLMQHHDAITGTEKQHVTNDYHKRLQAGPSLETALPYRDGVRAGGIMYVLNGKNTGRSPKTIQILWEELDQSAGRATAGSVCQESGGCVSLSSSACLASS